VRRAYIDWARGIAVLVMIQAHTLDAWTRLDARSTIAFRNLTFLGGFAAPLFLWLAGMAMVLSAEAACGRTAVRREATLAAVRRGLEIFILAYLFRLQALIVTPGGPLLTFFRVDILNVMGPSMVAAAVLWGLLGNRRGQVAAFATSAVTVAMVTPLVRDSPWVDALPIWLQWYIRPAGEQTTFTLFPWMGFLFAGSAVGALLAGLRDARSERRFQVALAGVGAVLIALGFAAADRPSIYRSSSFWTSSPTYFSIRVGILALALPTIYVLAALARRFSVPSRPLEKLGRSSLFVYWIHVELVYGYATWLLRHRLALWQTLVAYVVFCALMYAAVLARDRLLTRRRARGLVTEVLR
jgi:uncharacterized membrane protein